ncbi:MAG: hypothetical protein LBR79_05650 [Oscillospiraceae bacterium]|jgi:hypothetical protein|nr:hypothetical protein [Oscillospiraceae bacterium]
MPYKFSGPNVCLADEIEELARVNPDAAVKKYQLFKGKIGGNRWCVMSNLPEIQEGSFSKNTVPGRLTGSEETNFLNAMQTVV